MKLKGLCMCVCVNVYPNRHMGKGDLVILSFVQHIFIQSPLCVTFVRQDSDIFILTIWISSQLLSLLVKHSLMGKKGVEQICTDQIES